MKKNYHPAVTPKKETYRKSKVNWIEYDIDWLAMAKSSCKMCHGRGFEGYEPRTHEEEMADTERVKILCSCVADRWTKMSDDDRMKFATRKENAEEVVAKAKEEVKKVIDEEMASQ